MEAWRKQVVVGGIACVAMLMATEPASRLDTDGSAQADSTGEVRLPPLDLLDGDIVFRRGTDAVSRIALMYGERPRFSHVGMIVRTGESVSVVHAVPPDSDFERGVRLESLTSFSATALASEVAFYRIDALSLRQRTEVREYLLASIGMPFDYQFRYSDTSAHYCSELVVKALAAAGLELTQELSLVEGVTLAEPAIPPDAIRKVKLVRQIVD